MITSLSASFISEQVKGSKLAIWELEGVLRRPSFPGNKSPLAPKTKRDEIQ